MTREGARLLSVHVGVSQRLGEGTPPAVEVDRQRVGGLFEQLHLARGEGSSSLVAAALGVPRLDAEGAEQVPAERAGVADLDLRLTRAFAAPSREHQPLRRLALRRPPGAQDRPRERRYLEQLRAARLPPRRPAPGELALRDVEGLPPEGVQVSGAEPAKRAREHGHDLALADRDAPVLLWMLEREVLLELRVGEHGALLTDLRSEAG